MKLTQKIFAVIAAAGLAFGVFAATAAAATPYLNIVANSSGSNNVQLTITNGDPYAQINMYYRTNSGQVVQVSNFGQTDGNGNYSANLATDPIPPTTSASAMSPLTA